MKKDYSHIDISISEGYIVHSVEQRGNVIRVNYEREKEWKIKMIDLDPPATT